MNDFNKKIKPIRWLCKGYDRKDNVPIKQMKVLIFKKATST